MNYKLILFIFYNTISKIVSYNYYILSLQKWCSTDYMIHGLWPQNNKTSYPEYCVSVSYNNPQGNLLQEMNKYWHSCDNNNLWEHEWNKHGSCVKQQNNMSENQYFNKTITLFKKYIENHTNCTNEDCILGCYDLNFNQIDC